jgi:hypothetical protein
MVVPLVHLEDLYLGWTGLEGAFARLEELVLRPWWEGRPARFRAYDWLADQPSGPWVEVPASDCLVVEGCGCAPRAADRYGPLIIWLDGPVQLRRARVLKRDGDWEAPLLDAWEQATAIHFQREDTANRADFRWPQPRDPATSRGLT